MVNHFDPATDVAAASPCAKTCRLVGDTCGTCFRTLSEIGAWSTASRDEKRAINARIKKRRAQARTKAA